MNKRTSNLRLPEMQQGILAGNSLVLARAITRCESRKPADRKWTYRLLDQLLAYTGGSLRVGITGSPGVGKSTFIEALGKYLTAAGKKVAVLAIDPTSEKTRGSILGDKTRMDELARDERAFIRPTPTGTTLGGVAGSTRETILLCEAAGFDLVLVETVGVGQSETVVRGMVDFFLLLQLPGGGDELQGIKKGIMEMADGIVVTKADGDNTARARKTQVAYQHALHLFSPAPSGWAPQVLLASATERRGIDNVWTMIEDFRVKTVANGSFAETRIAQNIHWFKESLQAQLQSRISQAKGAGAKIIAAEKMIRQGKITPAAAAADVADALWPRRSSRI